MEIVLLRVMVTVAPDEFESCPSARYVRTRDVTDASSVPGSTAIRAPSRAAVLARGRACTPDAREALQCRTQPPAVQRQTERDDTAGDGGADERGQRGPRAKQGSDCGEQLHVAPAGSAEEIPGQHQRKSDASACDRCDH